MVSKPDFKSNCPSWFLGGVNMKLLFNSDIVKLMLKPNPPVGDKSLILLFL